jgi:hypothetical protein
LLLLMTSATYVLVISHSSFVRRGNAILGLRTFRFLITDKINRDFLPLCFVHGSVLPCRLKTCEIFEFNRPYFTHFFLTRDQHSLPYNRILSAVAVKYNFDDSLVRTYIPQDSMWHFCCVSFHKDSILYIFVACSSIRSYWSWVFRWVIFLMNPPSVPKSPTPFTHIDDTPSYLHQG